MDLHVPLSLSNPGIYWKLLIRLGECTNIITNFIQLPVGRGRPLDHRFVLRLLLRLFRRRRHQPLRNDLKLHLGPLHGRPDDLVPLLDPGVADEVQRLVPLSEAELHEDVFDLPFGGEPGEDALQRLFVHLSVVPLLGLRLFDDLEHLCRVVDDLRISN